MHKGKMQGMLLRGCTSIAIYLLWALFLSPVCPSVSIAQFNEESSFSLSIERPQGITWEGKKLWIVDEKTKHLYSLDPTTGSVTRSIPTNLKQPKGAAFDGKKLWVGDEETKTINAIDPETGQTVRTLKMELPGEKASFEGIT